MQRFFQAGTKRLALTRTYIMGVLNLTPDSFSDGGKFIDPEAALLHARQMKAEGADLIDIGGQSTRPGYQRISAEEEWDRLKEVLPAILSEVDLPISVDTFYPQVAEKALSEGVHIINDVTGFSADMLDAVKGAACGCIIMHPCGAQRSILQEVASFFSRKRLAAERKGIAADRLCFDPGIGFGKSAQENLQLIANVSEIKQPGCCFLMAASKKRVIGFAGGDLPVEQRTIGTVAAHTIAQFCGADMLRVHDVAEAVQASRVTDAIKGALRA